MFDVLVEKVEIVNRKGDKEVYELAPLSGEYLEDLYYVVEKFQKASKQEGDTMKVLGTDAVRKLHSLIYATLAQSYPEMAKEKQKLSQFVTQNLMQFIEPVLKINLPKEQE